jgi:aryl-alcohol dehydrogenase-like predicted oxidoreductase
VLTGKYLPQAALPADSRAADRAMSSFLNDAWLTAPVLAAVQALKPLAAKANLTPAQFAIAWVLRQPNVAAAIIGASRPEQVDENVAASGASVSPALFDEAQRIISDASAGIGAGSS